MNGSSSILNLALAQSLELELGVDVDDDFPRKCHLCWPYLSYQGAFCKTDRLWGHLGVVKTFDDVTCEVCKDKFTQLQCIPIAPELLKAFSVLAEHVKLLQLVEDGAVDYLWSVDCQEAGHKQYSGNDSIDHKDLLRKVTDASLAFHSKHIGSGEDGTT